MLLSLMALSVLAPRAVAAQATASEAPPQALSAHYVGGSVELQWDAPAEAADLVTAYQVLRGRPELGEPLSVLVSNTGISATTYVDTAASAWDTLYEYRVKAWRADVLSQPSTPADVLTPVDLGDLTALDEARLQAGRLEGVADEAVGYRFRLQAAKEVVMRLQSQESDADLILENEDGGVVDSSEEAGTADEWMSVTLAAGTYYAWVAAREVGASDYVFRYEVTAPRRDDAIDFGDLTDLARARFADVSLDGTVGAVAYWRFTLGDAKEVGLGLRRLDADADLVLEDEAGNVLGSSRASGTSNEWISTTLLAGTYYVRVEVQEAGANAFKLRHGVKAPDAAVVAQLQAALAAADATLSALSLDGVDLAPAFAAATSAYTATVGLATAEVTLRLSTTQPSATVQVVPADTDAITPGYQIPLAAVPPGAETADTTIAIMVTAADTTTRQTYALTVTRAPAPVRPGWLPEGCDIEQLDDTGGTLTKSGRWRRGCRSIIRFKESNIWNSPSCSVTGYARYFYFAVSEESDITITNTASDAGSQHYVIRNDAAEIIKHVLYHGDWRNPAECSAHYEIPCVPRRELQATLPAGAYLFELVQHYTTHPFLRPRMAFEITMSGSGLSSPALPYEFGAPQTQAALEGCTAPGEAASPLWSATLGVGWNASTVPSMSGYSVWTKRGSLSSTSFTHAGASYRVLALVLHAGGLYLHMTGALPGDFILEVDGQTFAASASSIPATRTAGRYWWPVGSLQWADGDEVEVSITGGAAVQFERPLAPPTAYFSYVPAQHDGSSAFGMRLYFGEALPVDAAAVAAAVEITNGTLTDVSAVTSGSTRVWELTVQPASAAAVTVALPPASSCASLGALCAADGRQLFNQPTVDIPGL